jgi:FkbM family methyltransferase
MMFQFACFGRNVNENLERGLRGFVRAIFRNSVIPAIGEDRAALWYRPSEYPSLLFGIGAFEKEYRSQWKAIVRPDDVIFDIGANIGLTVRRFASILHNRCSIVAFEPLPRNLDLLRRNGKPLKDRLTIVDCAVGDQNGDVYFEDNLNHGALSRLVQITDTGYQDKWNNSRKIQVHQITIDSFSAKENIKPTVLKIDVEGAAGLVLAGAKRTLSVAKPVITCSFHSSSERQAVTNALLACGYRGVQTDQQGECVWEDIGKADLFIHPDDPRTVSLKLTA